MVYKLNSQTTSGIYGIRSKIKSWYYIGQAIDIGYRWGQHKSALSGNYHHSPKLQHHYNKYGIEDLEFFLILETDSKFERNVWEKFFIACFDSWKKGFNCTQGGDGGAWRECTLQNINTGEIVSMSSIGEFAKQMGIKCQNQIGRVLDGKSKFVDEWFNPKGDWKPKMKKLRDPDGNIHKFFFSNRLADEHGLDKAGVCNVLSGKIQSTNGWTRDTGTNYKELGYYFKLIDPDGKIYEGRNLRQFAEQWNKNSIIKLDGNVLSEVWAGKLPSHKGWRKYIEGMELTKFQFPNKKFKFVSPDGQIFITDNVTQFAISKRLEPKNLSAVWNGKAFHHAYWTRYIEGIEPKPFYRKGYEFINPKGSIVITYNLNELARSEGLTATNLHRIVKKQRELYKGWKFNKII